METMNLTSGVQSLFTLRQLLQQILPSASERSKIKSIKIFLIFFKS